MEAEEKESVDVWEDEQDDEEKEEIDLFGNKRRRTLSVEGARRATQGLPDNGAGLTKDYYNIDRPMSITSLVDLIVLRRTGNEGRPRRRSTQLSRDLEERIKKTLAWKEMEDELNKEDVMVNFRKKMRELRKEARQSIPKETKIERKINEERRIQLRTSLLQPNTRRRSTTESIKDAIQEFRTRPPAIIEEPQESKVFEEDKEATDIVQRTRDLLEQMGYLKLKSANVDQTPASTMLVPRQPPTSSIFTTSSEDSNDGLPKKKKKKVSQSGSDKSLSTKPITSKTSKINQELTKHPAQRNITMDPNAFRPQKTSKSSSKKSDQLKPVSANLQNKHVAPSHAKKISSGYLKPLSQRI